MKDPGYKLTSLLLLVVGYSYYDGAVVMAAPKDGEVETRSLSFFGLFAKKKNRNRFRGRLDCVYGHPTKGKMCPPVMKDPMAHLKESVDEGVLTAFSRCLDDPDLEECRQLSVGGLSPSSQVAAAPGYARNLELATLSPTTDDWCVLLTLARALSVSESIGKGALSHPLLSFVRLFLFFDPHSGGNMFDPRFCASQMPSVSQAPTDETLDDGEPPSHDRIVKTPSPTLCPDRKISPFIKTAGSETCPVLFDSDSLPITLTGKTMETVSFKLVHTFPEDLTYLALSYPDAAGKPVCLVQSSPDVGAASGVVETVCDETGFVQLDVVAGAPGFKGLQPTATVPDTCAVPAGPACLYHLAIPCACEEGSAEPTQYDSTGERTADPTSGEPTGGPTAGPTSGPTR